MKAKKRTDEIFTEIKHNLKFIDEDDKEFEYRNVRFIDQETEKEESSLTHTCFADLAFELSISNSISGMSYEETESFSWQRDYKSTIVYKCLCDFTYFPNYSKFQVYFGEKSPSDSFFKLINIFFILRNMFLLLF